jgi:hypothetical protein
MLASMPKATDDQIRRRGGVLRWRTITLRDGRRARVAITRDPGPRGGKTMIVRVLDTD